ncbi:MAG: hypothetical protein OXH66_03445 [Gemmatimonadetes bacterium]|nr:hypothetical protein [Gemmatimonadota bacterium]
MADMKRVHERLAKHREYMKTTAAWKAAFERAKAGQGLPLGVCRDCGRSDRMWTVVAPPGLSDAPCTCCNSTEGAILVADVTQCVRCAGSCEGCGWPEGTGHYHECPNLGIAAGMAGASG